MPMTPMMAMVAMVAMVAVIAMAETMAMTAMKAMLAPHPHPTPPRTARAAATPPLGRGGHMLVIVLSYHIRIVSKSSYEALCRIASSRTVSCRIRIVS